MQNKTVIPEQIFLRYNIQSCFKIVYTEKGLELLSERYRSVRALPAFLHNLFRGRPTRERELLFKNSNLSLWIDNESAFTVPQTEMYGIISQHG